SIGQLPINITSLEKINRFLIFFSVTQTPSHCTKRTKIRMQPPLKVPCVAYFSYYHPCTCSNTLSATRPIAPPSSAPSKRGKAPSNASSELVKGRAIRITEPEKKVKNKPVSQQRLLTFAATVCCLSLLVRPLTRSIPTVQAAPRTSAVKSKRS